MRRYSRYDGVPYIRDGEKKRNFLRESIHTDPHPSDQYVEVKVNDRIDTLAYEYLGKPDLWWVIADYNHLMFPLVLEPGSILRIPSYEHLYMDVLGG